MNEKAVERLGWIASVMAIAMFASYIDQIRLNLSGHPGSLILPIMTVINCSAWVCYAYLKKNRDYPIILCNGFGVLIGIATAVTTIGFN